MAPVVRVRRKDSSVTSTSARGQETIEGWSCQTGVPIAQTRSEVLIVINNHFLNGSNGSFDCLLGERSQLRGRVVATDPKSDLALVVGDVGTGNWKLATLAEADAVPGAVVETIGFPKDGPIYSSTSQVTAPGWVNRRFVEGESGGPVFQDSRLVGIISCRTPGPADLTPEFFRRSRELALKAGEQPGTPDEIRADMAELERQGKLGAFVPMHSIRTFVEEAAVKLSADYPVFKQFKK